LKLWESPPAQAELFTLFSVTSIQSVKPSRYARRRSIIAAEASVQVPPLLCLK